MLVKYQKLWFVFGMHFNTCKIPLLAPVKTRRSWCKLEYEVDYYQDADRQMSNIEISSTVAVPPPLVAVTLSLVTLSNTKTHETEV